MSVFRERVNHIDTEGAQKATLGCAGGCLTFIGLGVIAGLFGTALGASCSVRVPYTESNISGAASVGEKQQAEIITPDYLQNRDRDLAYIDAQAEVLIGSLRFKNVGSIGRQPNSPRLEVGLLIPDDQHTSRSFGFRQLGITVTDNTQEKK